MQKSERAWMTRVVRLTVLPKGSSLNHDKVTDIYLDDEGAGEFVSVKQEGHTVNFDRDEWPSVRDAIDRMVAEICDGEIQK